MKQVVLDTNFLLIPYTLKVDIFSEIKEIMDLPYEICLLDESLNELNKIIETQSGRHKQAAKFALKLIDLKKLVILETKQKDLKRRLNSNELVVDDILLGIANENMIIATQDKEFKKKMSNKGINYNYLKNRKLVKNVL